MTKHKVTSKKFEGDDEYSYAVFVNGNPVVTGLSRSEAAYHKKVFQKKYAEQSKQLIVK